MANKLKKSNAPAKGQIPAAGKGPKAGKPLAKPRGEMKTLYYLTPEEVTAKDLSLAIHSVAADHIEVWRELNIMEVVLENDSLVFEDATSVWEDADDLLFLSRHHIKSSFYTDYSSLDEQAVQAVYTELLAAFGGMLCSETEDFRPIYRLADGKLAEWNPGIPIGM